MLKEIVFPLAYLSFMFPLPLAVIEKISSPMKQAVAYVGSRVVSYLGIPVYQIGYYIETSKGTLQIDNPCSGLRSLIAFMAAAAILAYICNTSLRKKIILFSFSIPIALITNFLRVVFLIYMTSEYGSSFASPGEWVHDFSGYGSFLLGGVILFSIGKTLEWKT